ncbi:Uncharacterised protein [Bordetella pertussis]|nr:Uncharacterised protein [Bordetella pertussis]
MRQGRVELFVFGVGLAQRETQQHVVGTLRQHGFQALGHGLHKALSGKGAPGRRVRS